MSCANWWSIFLKHQRRYVLAIDLAVSRQRGADEPGERGQKVDITGDLVGDGAGRNAVGPSHDTRLAYATLENTSFFSSPRCRRTNIGTIVTGENHKRL